MMYIAWEYDHNAPTRPAIELRSKVAPRGSAAKIIAISTSGYSANWSEKGMMPRAFGPSNRPNNPAIMLAGRKSTCTGFNLALRSLPIKSNKNIQSKVGK